MRRVLLSIVCALWAAAAWAAPDTTTCTDTVYVGGVAATGGTVKATLSERGSIADGSSTVTVQGQITATIAGNGAYTLALWPNDSITPNWTFWNVEFRVTGPTSAGWTEMWVVQTTPDPVACAAIQRITAAPGRQLTNNYVEYVSTAQPSGSCTANDKPRQYVGANPPSICVCRNGTWDCDVAGGGGGGSSIVLDLGDGGPVESSGLLKIITVNDTGNVFTESLDDTLRVNVGAVWPIAGSLSGPLSVCNAGTAPRGITTSGGVSGCTDYTTQVEHDNHILPTSMDHDPRYFTKVQQEAGACNSSTEKQYGVDSDGSPLCASDLTGSGGTPNVLDLADDGGTPESADLVEIATINDNAGAAAVFQESSANKLLIDLSKDWPSAALAKTGDAANSFFSTGELERARMPALLPYEDEANTYTLTQTVSAPLIANDPATSLRLGTTMSTGATWLLGPETRNQLLHAERTGTSTVSGTGGSLTVTNPDNVFMAGTRLLASTTVTGTGDTARITITDAAGLDGVQSHGQPVNGWFVSVQQLGGPYPVARDITVEAQYDDQAGGTTWRQLAAVTGQTSTLWAAQASTPSFVMNQQCTASTTPHACCTGSGTGTCGTGEFYGFRVTLTNWTTTGLTFIGDLGLHHRLENLDTGNLSRDGDARFPMLGPLRMGNATGIRFHELANSAGEEYITTATPGNLTANRTIQFVDNAAPIAGSSIEVSSLATVPRATRGGCIDADLDGTCEVSLVGGQLRLDSNDDGDTADNGDATLDANGLIVNCAAAGGGTDCRIEAVEEDDVGTCGASQNWLKFIDTSPGTGSPGLWRKCAHGTITDLDTTAAGADADYLVLALNGAISQERQFVAGAGVAATDGGANGNYTLTTDSSEAGFLKDGGTTDPPTCGGSNFGRMWVMDDGDITYCDGAATSTPQSLDSRIQAVAGNASNLTAGTVAVDRGGTGTNISGFTNGLVGVVGGAVTDVDLSSEVASAISDETGTGALVLAAGPTLTGTVAIGESCSFRDGAILCDQNNDTITDWAYVGDYDDDGVLEMLDIDTVAASMTAGGILIVAPGTYQPALDIANTKGLIELSSGTRLECSKGTILKGPLSYSGTADGTSTDGVLTPTVSQSWTTNALVGFTAYSATDNNGCTITSNNADSATCSTPKASGTFANDAFWITRTADDQPVVSNENITGVGDHDIEVVGCEIDGGMPPTGYNPTGLNVGRAGISMQHVTRWNAERNFVHDTRHTGIYAKNSVDGKVTKNDVRRVGNWQAATGGNAASVFPCFYLFADTAYTDTHDGSANAATLSDAGAAFPVGVDSVGLLVDLFVVNSTDSSACKITANTATTITCTLAGGTDNDWDAGDAYTVGGISTRNTYSDNTCTSYGSGGLSTRANAVQDQITNFVFARNIMQGQSNSDVAECLVIAGVDGGAYLGNKCINTGSVLLSPVATGWFTTGDGGMKSDPANTRAVLIDGLSMSGCNGNCITLGANHQNPRIRNVTIESPDADKHGITISNPIRNLLIEDVQVIGTNYSASGTPSGLYMSNAQTVANTDEQITVRNWYGTYTGTGAYGMRFDGATRGLTLEGIRIFNSTGTNSGDGIYFNGVVEGLLASDITCQMRTANDDCMRFFVDGNNHLTFNGIRQENSNTGAYAVFFDGATATNVVITDVTAYGPSATTVGGAVRTTAANAVTGYATNVRCTNKGGNPCFLDNSGDAWTFVNVDGETFDVEATGNTVQTVDKTWFPAAGCNGTTASPFYDLFTSAVPAVACITGTNTTKGVLDFDDTTDENAQLTHMLTSDFTGTADVRLKWLAAATTGATGWCAQIVCVADAETDDPAFAAQAAGNCVSDTAKGTTLQTNDATITGATITGCAAGELMHVQISRDANGGAVTDSMTGDARLIGFELTLRRAQ